MPGRSQETISYRTRAYWRRKGATGTPSAMIQYGKHRQVGATSERLHEWIEVSSADAEQNVGSPVDGSYDRRSVYHSASS